jgi:hypothetical protein
MIFIEVPVNSMYNKAMPHGKTSCRTKGFTVVRIQLEQLYAKRSAVDAAIQELELRQVIVRVNTESTLQQQNSEFSSDAAC